jgi:hypothetical protein
LRVRSEVLVFLKGWCVLESRRKTRLARLGSDRDPYDRAGVLQLALRGQVLALKAKNRPMTVTATAWRL